MDLGDAIYQDEDEARQHLEAIRWPNGPICPHCGTLDRASKVSGGRKGLYFCNACRQQYTVTVGTVYERSKIPLHKWVLATHLIVSSKTAISAHQIHRMLGITSKSAWFLCHRIREAFADVSPDAMGGPGGQVQADETYIGNTSKRAKGYRKGHRHKQQVVALVEPSTGRAKAFHVKTATKDSVREILVHNAHRTSTLVTDESNLYTETGKEFADHQTVKHTGLESHYVNPRGFTTNNVENFFGVFKRGFRGTYSHCEAQHLQRYLNEFDFRYTHRKITDRERADMALAGIEGKRLTYRRINEASDKKAVGEAPLA
jgi:transposase-like protein